MPGWLTDLFARYGYAVVFVGVLLENAGAPVPGETMLLAGAALARFGSLRLTWVIAAAIVGATLGDNLGFFIGRRGGRVLVERYGAMIGMTRAHLAKFDRFFDRHGAKTVFVARFITGLRVLGALLAGASRLTWSRFLVFNALGAVVWATTFGLVGYALGYSWLTLEQWIGRSGLILLALVSAIGGLAILRARWRLS
ncbi:MAG TPA: DedA family protein [Vicinamibacterales bacterium]|nr:DedA family protein [Vicinamibacterales bacterium]